MQTAVEEVQALKRIMVHKIQKAHQREQSCVAQLAGKNSEIKVLEKELTKVQDQSKKAIDDLVAELQKKDRQLFRMSQSYRQLKDDLSKTKHKLSVTTSHRASVEAEMKRSKTRIASMTESLTIAQIASEIKKTGPAKHASESNHSFEISPPSSRSPSPTKSRVSLGITKSQINNYKKFAERALDWLTSFEPDRTENYMDHALQITPFVVAMNPLPQSGAEFLLKVAHHSADLPSTLKYYHLPKSKEQDPTVMELLLLITICGRSSRQKDGGELTDAILSLKSKDSVPRSIHAAVTKSFSYLSSDRSFRKDVVEILFKNEITDGIGEDLLRTLYLAVAQNDKYEESQKSLFAYLAHLCGMSRHACCTLERLGLVTILKRIRLEVPSIPKEIQELHSLLCERNA